jgi:ABC-type glycerol-3-phosphate transport system substrate-binding protein
MKSALSAFAMLAACALPAAAQTAQAITCAAPFHKDASHDSIEKAFGKENVTFETVPGP